MQLTAEISHFVLEPTSAPAADGRSRAAFALFVLVNAALFIRPSELLPGLEPVPVYGALIAACAIVALPEVLRQLSLRSLRHEPITLALVLLLPAVLLSHLLHFRMARMVENGLVYGKILLYYLLLVGVVDSPRRLSSLLRWLVLFMIVVSALPLLQYYGYIDLEAMRPVRDLVLDRHLGKEVHVDRLRGIGIFGDPNDLSQMLSTGIVMCLLAIRQGRGSDGRGRLMRWIWLAPLGLFFYTIGLTLSRGGLLALMGGVGAVMLSQGAWRKGLLIGMVLLPLAPFVLRDRQLSISTTEQTGQERIQMWSDALQTLKQNPLFGVGFFEFGNETELVAHNSFMQAYAELGLFGGTLFFIAFFLSLRRLVALRRRRDWLPPDVELLRPYVLGIVAAYAVGMMSLTRNFVPPTYMIPAIAVAYLGLARRSGAEAIEPITGRRIVNLAAWSIAFLVFVYGFVRASVVWE